MKKQIYPEKTRQIYKIHSFIYERDFDKMSLVINFSIDKWTESIKLKLLPIQY